MTTPEEPHVVSPMDTSTDSPPVVAQQQCPTDHEECGIESHSSSVDEPFDDDDDAECVPPYDPQEQDPLAKEEDDDDDIVMDAEDEEQPQTAEDIAKMLAQYRFTDYQICMESLRMWATKRTGDMLNGRSSTDKLPIYGDNSVESKFPCSHAAVSHSRM